MSPPEDVFEYLGIDFGTSNSYFAASKVMPQLVIELRDLKFEYGASSIPTSVLWKTSAGRRVQVLAIGDNAEERWITRSDEERKTLQLGTNFKPDLASSSDARADAEAFLSAARETLRKDNQLRRVGREEGAPVIIGVPAKSSDEFKNHLTTIASNARLGAIECIEEPKGALAWCLHEGRVTEEEARRGVVVVDFGGGTLDMALVNERGVREPWGNPIVGGRLFDDLFYQWVLDQNPGAADDFDQKDLAYANRIGARKLKEAFSTAWKKGTLGGFSRRLEVRDRLYLARLQNPSVEEFEERARNYQPSAIAGAYFTSLRGPLAALCSRRTDLFALIRDAVLGPNAEGRAAAEASWIILTGGGCGWPFMKPLVADVLKVAPDRIIVPEDPMRVIGQGIALYPAMRELYRLKSDQVSADVPDLKKELEDHLDKMSSAISERVAYETLGPLVDYAETRFRTWYDHGGRLKDAQDAVVARANQQTGQSIAAEWKKHWEQLAEFTVGAAVKWAKSHGVVVTNVQRPVVETKDPPPLPNIVLDISGTMTAMATVMVTALALAIGVAVKAGLVAVFGWHPAGWLVLLIIGGTAYASYDALLEGIQDWIKEFDFADSEYQMVTVPTSLWILHSAISKERFEANLSEQVEKAKLEFKEKLLDSMRSDRASYIRYVDDIAKEALRRLGLLEAVAKW
jgi:molecular chaperone DnaK